MGDEYVTRTEHQSAVDRLDRADEELRKANTELERYLRQDYEAKIADAVSGITHVIATGDAQTQAGIDRIDKHLTWQDRTLVGSALTFVVMIAVAAVSHFIYHVG